VNFPVVLFTKSVTEFGAQDREKGNNSLQIVSSILPNAVKIYEVFTL
jgi:hypothetical protein